MAHTTTIVFYTLFRVSRLMIVICLSCQWLHGPKELKAFDQSALVYADEFSVGLRGNNIDEHLLISPS